MKTTEIDVHFDCGCYWCIAAEDGGLRQYFARCIIHQHHEDATGKTIEVLGSTREQAPKQATNA